MTLGNVKFLTCRPFFVFFFDNFPAQSYIIGLMKTTGFGQSQTFVRNQSSKFKKYQTQTSSFSWAPKCFYHGIFFLFHLFSDIFHFLFSSFFMLVLFVVLVVKCVPWDFKVWNATPGRNLFLFDV